MVPLGAKFIELSKSIFETFKCGIIIKITANKPHTLLKLVPDIFTERGTCIFFHRLTHIVTKIIVIPLAAPIPNKTKTWGQQTTIH